MTKMPASIVVSLVLLSLSVAMAEEVSLKQLGFSFRWDKRFSQHYYQIENDIHKIVLSDWGKSLPLTSGRLSQATITIYFLGNPLKPAENTWYKKFMRDNPDINQPERNEPPSRRLPDLSMTVSPKVSSYKLIEESYSEFTHGGPPKSNGYHGYTVCKVFQNDTRTVVVVLKSIETPPEKNEALKNMLKGVVLSK